MTLGTIEVLLILLVVCAILGVVLTVRRSRISVAETPDREAYLLCAAMVCCALFGVWRYFRYSRVVSEQTAASEKRLKEFMTPRALRIRSADPLEIELTFLVACEVFGDAARRQVCASGAVLSDRALPAAIRDDLRNRFAGPIEIGLSPAQRITRDNDDPLLRYLARKDDVAELTLAHEPDRNDVVITVRLAIAAATEPSVPFIDADSADMRVSLRSSGCATSACQVKRLGFAVDNQWLCADRFRHSTASDHEFYSGRVRRCQSPRKLS